MQMLAVNGKVIGYCVHWSVNNLQTVKSTENVSRLRESPKWKQLLPSTCLSEMPFPCQDAPPSTKSGVGVYEDRGVILTTGQPCLSLNPSPQSLHQVQLFGRHSWLKTRLKQAEWAQIAHETKPSGRLPDHPDGVGPSHHLSLHCPHCEDDFYLLQCLIFTFLAQDMLSQRLKTTILVTVAARYWVWCQNGKNCHLGGLMMGKKTLHFVHSGQKLWGFKVKSIKNGAKSAYLDADFGVGSHFGLLHKQKRSKSKLFFSPEP